MLSLFINRVNKGTVSLWSVLVILTWIIWLLIKHNLITQEKSKQKLRSLYILRLKFASDITIPDNAFNFHLFQMTKRQRRSPRKSQNTNLLRIQTKYQWKSVPSDLILVWQLVQVALLCKAIIRCFGDHKREKRLETTQLWMNYVIVYGHGWVKGLILRVKHFPVLDKGNMAMERASLTWLVLVALSLTSCQFSNVGGKLPVINYKNIVDRLSQTISTNSKSCLN